VDLWQLHFALLFASTIRPVADHVEYRKREKRADRQTDRQMYHSVAEQTIHKLRNPLHAEPRGEQLVNRPIWGLWRSTETKTQHSSM